MTFGYDNSFSGMNDDKGTIRPLYIVQSSGKEITDKLRLTRTPKFRFGGLWPTMSITQFVALWKGLLTN